MDASRHSFLTADHRGMAAVLAAAAIRRDHAPEARLGRAGIAMLPDRLPAEGQRYRVPLAKLREELDRYLPVASQQATDRLRSLVTDGASPTVIGDARSELAYVRDAKGPVYQAHLLEYLGIRQVDTVITRDQTPLECVRAIGEVLGVQIGAQRPEQLQRAVRALERPVLPPGHAPDRSALRRIS